MSDEIHNESGLITQDAREGEILEVKRYTRKLHRHSESLDESLTLPEWAKIYTDVFCN